MFKKLVIFLAVTIVIVSVNLIQGQEVEEQKQEVTNVKQVDTVVSPMTTYKDNYFLFGDKKNQVTFKVSAKYEIFYPSKLDLFLGYTQKSLWHLYDQSSPFYETNYNPEGFLLFENKNNIFNDADFGFVDYIQLSPISHLSNGRDGVDSRSTNMYYGEIQLSYGTKYNIGTNIKVNGYYDIAEENEDYNDYKKYYEAIVFFKVRSKNVQYLDKETLQVRFSGTPWGKGFYEVTGSFRVVTSVFQPRFYIQYFDGYNEFMIDYNKKSRVVRAGLAFIN